MKAENIKGKVYINHSLPTDADLANALSHFGWTGFVTNFGVNSSYHPNTEQGRAMCSCGWRGNIGLNWNSTGQTWECPNCGGKMKYIYAPRYERYAYAHKNQYAVTTIYSVRNADGSLTIHEHEVAAHGSADNKFVVLEVNDKESLIIDTDGNIDIPSAPAFPNIYRADNAMMNEFVDTYPPLRDVLGDTIPNDKKFANNIASLFGDFMVLSQFVRGIKELPMLYNPTNFSTHRGILLRFTKAQAQNNFQTFLDSKKPIKSITIDELYLKEGFPIDWPDKEAIFNSSESSWYGFTSLYGNIPLSVKELMLEDSLFKWVAHRQRHDTISKGAINSVIRIIALHVAEENGLSCGLTRNMEECLKYYDEFVDFYIRNFDHYGDNVSGEFCRRANNIVQAGGYVSADMLRNREYLPTVNLGKYRTLKNTDVLEMIDDDPLGLIQRLRK